MLIEQADFATFVLLCALVWGILSMVLGFSKQHAVAILLGWQFLAVVLVPGWWLVQSSGDREATRLQNLIVGYAPIYAQEMERMGHANLSNTPAADDPLYLSLIAAEKRWQDTNPAIADVYTFRRLASGEVVLVVDAETDYDRDGQYAGKLESRTPPGEVYDEVTPEMLRSFEQGTIEVDGPVTDRWGTWIAASVPLRNAQGEIEGVLGVDYPAGEWLHAVAMARLSTMAVLGLVLIILLSALSIISLQNANIGRYRHVATALQKSLTEGADARARLELQARQLQAQNLQLETARLEAEGAARAKSEFLANMSHEIRTPMTAILGFAETLLEGEVALEKISAVQTIQRNGAHLLEIINDVLDLSKIEANKLSIELSPCRLDLIIEETCTLMSVRTDAKGLKLAVELGADLPTLILSDATRLRQILINLVGNAIKFTPEGSVRITTRVLGRQDRTADIEIAIIDSGIGMDANQVQRLFLPFSQADNSMSRRFGGTGLGLNISQRLASMLGGEIVAESRPGQGSTFRFKFRVEVPVAMSLPSAHSPVTLACSASGALPKGLRILLAEDGPDNQRLIAHILRKAGAVVTIAENGAAALEAVDAIVSSEPFDVILMDMQMPILDGYSATRHLRDQGYDGTIIALTAHAMPGDRERCLRAGCTSYATKPIQRPALLELIASLLPGAVGKSEIRTSKSETNSNIKIGNEDREGN